MQRAYPSCRATAAPPLPPSPHEAARAGGFTGWTANGHAVKLTSRMHDMRVRAAIECRALTKARSQGGAAAVTLRARAFRTAVEGEGVRASGMAARPPKAPA